MGRGWFLKREGLTSSREFIGSMIAYLAWYHTISVEGTVLKGCGHFPCRSLASSLLQGTVGFALARVKDDGFLVAVVVVRIWAAAGGGVILKILFRDGELFFWFGKFYKNGQEVVTKRAGYAVSK